MKIISLTRVALLLALVIGLPAQSYAAAPTIEVSPSSLDFGTIVFGSNGQLQTTVNNSGDADLEVTALTTTHGTYSVVSPPAPFTLSPGASQAITVAFSPTAVAVWNAELFIDSDDANRARVAVALSGQGTALSGCGGGGTPTVDIDVSPLSLDFGDIDIGIEQLLTVIVSNTGTADLELTALHTTNSSFTVVSPSLPVILPTGSNQAITVAFNPTETGATSGELLVDSNDADETRIAVALNGQGLPAPGGGLFPADFSAIYVMGDSYGVRNQTNADVYATRLAGALSLPLANASISGWTTGDILSGRSGSPSQLRTLFGNPLVADPDALYIVWGGFNDVFYKDDSSPIDLDQAILNMREIFSRLESAGARYIMVPDLLDVGRWPNAGTDAAALRLRTLEYNAKLELLLEELTGQGTLRFMPVPVYDTVESIMADPGSHGFTDTTSECRDNVSYSMEGSKPVANCDGYFFWDHAHATDGFHSSLALDLEILLSIAADPAPEVDSDYDGRPDRTDAFPFDPLEQLDSDRDGTGNNADLFPADPTESLDSDGDGVGDNSDPTPNGEQPIGEFSAQLQNVASGQCVEVSGTADGGNVYQVACSTGQTAQTLNFIPIAGGSNDYRLVFDNSGKCLDVTGASSANGANIQQLSCNGGVSQRFTLVDRGGEYTLYTQTGNNKVVDLYVAIDNIIQWQDYGNPNQRWRLFNRIDGAGPTAPDPDTNILSAGAPSGDAFYQPPSSLDGSNGKVYWAEEIESASNGRIWKVLYRSEDLHGTAIAVSGWLAIPNTSKPAGGYPIMAFAHGTTGLADSCAPTRWSTPDLSIALLEDFLARGYVVVATDYQGLGTPGTHHYLIGPSEAHGVLDSARAARNIAGGATDVVLFGHSQGGQAVLFANELAPVYAPELTILGTISSGSAVSGTSGSVVEALKTSDYKGYLVMAAVAQRAAYGSAESPLSRWLTPYGIQAADALDSICVDQLTSTYASLSGDDVFVANAPLPTTTNQYDVDADTTPGLRVGASPLLMLHGRYDTQIPPSLIPPWAEETCNRGQRIQLNWFDTGHRVPYEASQSAASVMFDWIDDRIAGLVPSSNCDMPQP